MSKRLSTLIVLLAMALCTWAQSLTVTEEIKLVPNSSVLAMYKNQFGKWEKPYLDDTFPYVVIRIKLQGNAREVKGAKKMVGLYLGTQTAVEAVWKDNENELLFLIPSRVRHVEITCGDGCAKQTIIDAMQLHSNMVYSGAVHYVPAEEEGAPSIYQAPKRQFFKFFVTPADASVRVQVNGSWQRWPVEEGMASKSLNHGKYKYEVSAANHTIRTGEIVVSDVSRELTINLAPKFGWLQIASDSILNEAYVFVTNTETSATQQLGQLPLTSIPQLDGGSYQLEIQKEKYKTYSETIDIIPGDTVKLHPQLEANFGEVTLTIEDDPEAEIYIDDQLLGKGKWVGTLESGKYSVESRRTHHHSTYTTIDVADGVEGQSFVLNAPLPIYGALVIEGSPNVCEVYLDNQSIGKTPLIVNQVLAGTHTLRIEKKGHLPYTTEIEIDENGEKVVEYELKKGTAPAEKPKQVNTPEQSTLKSRVDSALNTLPEDATDTTAAPTKRRILNTVLLYEGSYDFSMKGDSILKKLTHGAFFGQAYNGVGWYLKGRSNFNLRKPTNGLSTDNYGKINGILPYYSGRTEVTEWIAAGGLMLDFLSMGQRQKTFKRSSFGIYFGGGYGERNMLWQTVNGTWIKYTPNSYSGVCGDAGLIMSIAGFSLNCGATTIGFKYTELHFGIGFTL